MQLIANSTKIESGMPRNDHIMIRPTYVDQVKSHRLELQLLAIVKDIHWHQVPYRSVTAGKLRRIDSLTLSDATDNITFQAS